MILSLKNQRIWSLEDQKMLPLENGEKLLKEIRNVELRTELKRTKSDIFQRRETNYQDTIAIKDLHAKKLNYTLIGKTVY